MSQQPKKMNNTLWGIPFWVLAIPCLGIATLYYFLWPKPKENQLRPLWVHFVLRWFHSLVWVLLAGACLLWGAGSGLGNPISLLAGLVYLVFIGTMIFEKLKANS